MQRDQATDLARASGFGRRLNRRQFLAGAAGAGATLMAGGLMGVGASLVRAAPFKGPDESAPWFERTIPELNQLMASRQLTSRELTQAYLGRDQPAEFYLLGAVIETSPDAIGIAAQRDAERRRGIVRGPLHGIPILLKDNIATADRMQTTAGSLALVGTRVPADAPLVANLRAAGAVILGKTNLSEWANFRGFPPEDFPFATNYLNGWSARGGFMHDPYLLGFDPCGSSSGSGVAPAVNMCAAAVGTETDGSIVCPAGNNGIVGLKPTIGLISQAGIVPIAHSQDSAGPMTRTVRDTAIMLNVMRSPFGPVLGQSLPADYTAFLNPSLEGLRIGIERRQFLPEYFALPERSTPWSRRRSPPCRTPARRSSTRSTPGTRSPGSTPSSSSDVRIQGRHRRLPVRPAAYPLRHPDADPRRSHRVQPGHCEEEMKFFGQEIFELSEALSGQPHRSGLRRGPQPVPAI